MASHAQVYENPDLPPLIDQQGVIAPEAPADVYGTGVDGEILADLALKAAFTVPQCSTEWVAQHIHLPMPLVEGLMQQMKTDQLLEVLGQLGPFNNRYAITDLGRERARRLMEICGYIGSAPISLETYTAMLDWQLSQYPMISLEMVRRSVAHLVLPEEDVYTCALAVMSHRSLFLSGPPGNGKTSVATALHNAIQGDLWIPYCIGVGNDIVRVFDPESHRMSDFESAQPWKLDRRWVRIKRPIIVAGGEMTIDSLDLSYSPSMRFYEAPLHFRSNGGTFVIDDFGRQRVAPSELLNRWIIPLEHRHDFLTMRSGLKVQVPFRQMLVVATNLDPQRVMDPAFLRRMGYRVVVDSPTTDRYCEIFKRYASQFNINVPPGMMDNLMDRYGKEKRELRSCEPRDLIERVKDICRLRRQPAELNEDFLDMAWAGYFGIKRQRKSSMA